ncbi:WD40 repeat domain-containing protein [Deinococcus sp. KSM4-11]|uniref:WD40 repeat domain-containing protein n=1 Tax=Deinococcus sp. KSM4-11 TaxID=2568654 RepID=UPI001454C298|nr:PQQ-binding-like beta-propeller repeat protein [Deinococcus sp. KSM4-11]
MRLPSVMLLALTVTLGGAASALTLHPAGVYAVPGADVNFAWGLPGGRWAVSADNAVMVLGPDLKVMRAWHTLPGAIRALAVDPQGTRVAAMTRDRWSVWNLESGAELGSGQVYGNTLGFDADSNLLVMYHGALLRNTLEGGPERFRALEVGTSWDFFAVSPDGTHAVLMDGAQVQLVELAGGKVLASADLSDDPDGLAATFSPDGQAVVVRTGQEALILRSGEDALDIKNGSDLDLNASALYFSGDSQFVSVSGRRAQAYDLATGLLVGERFSLPASGGVVRGTDGRFLAVGRGVATFDPVTHTEQRRTDLVSSNAWLGAFLPDGKFYAGVDDLRALKGGLPLNVGPVDDLYGLEAQGGRIWTLNGTTVRVTQAGKVRALATLDEDAEYDTIAPTPDGTQAVVSGYYGLALVNAATGKVSAQVTSDGLKMEDIHAALPTPDGRGILIIPHSGEVVRYDVATGHVKTAFHLPSGASPSALQATPSGTLAVTYTDEDDASHVALIRPGTATPYRSLAVTASVQGLRFSPDGKLLALLSGGALNIYDTASGARLASAGPFNNVTSLITWAGSGKQVMVGSGLLGRAGSITVFNVLR